MRAMKADGGAFRVRRAVTWKPDSEPHVTFHGPYATVGVARAQETRLRGRYERSIAYAPGYPRVELTLQTTPTDWVDVPPTPEATAPGDRARQEGSV